MLGVVCVKIEFWTRQTNRILIVTDNCFVEQAVIIDHNFNCES